MRVPVSEDVKDETEEENTEEDENEDDRVSGQAPTEEGYLFLSVDDQKCFLSLFSGQVFSKPVIEDLSMELARKCTELISDVSGLCNFCLIWHCMGGDITSWNQRAEEKNLEIVY